MTSIITMISMVFPEPVTFCATTLEHPVPLQPALHVHVPVFVSQVPFLPQAEGHGTATGTLQSAPLQPALHLHVPVFVSQVPFLPQFFEQTIDAVVHAGPDQPALHSQFPVLVLHDPFFPSVPPQPAGHFF